MADFMDNTGNLPEGIEYDKEGFFRWNYEKKLFHAPLFFLLLCGGIGSAVFAFVAPYRYQPPVSGRMALGFGGIALALATLVYGVFCLFNLGKRVYLFTLNEERVTKSMPENQVGLLEFLGHSADLFQVAGDSMIGYESMGELLANGGKVVLLKELSVFKAYPKKKKIILRGKKGRIKLQMTKEQYRFVEKWLRQYGRNA
ncbi:MAG: hypothetical protein IJ733_09550 [Lachnospiraceae bacterium]|nr:hypothetical protein [Lachnospiraceae bacterium]